MKIKKWLVVRANAKQISIHIDCILNYLCPFSDLDTVRLASRELQKSYVAVFQKKVL